MELGITVPTNPTDLNKTLELTIDPSKNITVKGSCPKNTTEEVDFKVFCIVVVHTQIMTSHLNIKWRISKWFKPESGLTGRSIIWLAYPPKIRHLD